MYQLIVFKDREPIIVSDEKYKDGNFVLLPYSFEVRKCVNSTTFIEGSKKIIAGLPELPSINYNGFKDTFGIVDVEKLAEDNVPESPYISKEETLTKRKYFKKGFKAAQSLNEKKYSEEKVTKAISQVLKRWGTSCIDVKGEANIEFLAEIEITLSQPKVFDIEVEMERITDDDDHNPTYHGDKSKPKITNNSIKIIKVL